MEDEKLKKAIIDFVQKDYKNYIVDNEIIFSRFWLKMYPNKNWEKNLINHEKPQRIIAPSGFMKSPYGEYSNWAEIDGIHYSFSVLKSQKLDGELANIVNVLSELSKIYEDDDSADKEEKFRFKKLRISFFECLYSTNFALSNVELYNRIAQAMIDNLTNVKRIIEENDRKVIYKTFDSVGFEAKDKEDALRILDIVNQNVQYKMHLKFYKRAVHFLNYLVYLTEDNKVVVKRLTYSSFLPQMEDLKERISLLLLKREYRRAMELVKTVPLVPDPKGKIRPDRFKRSYMKALFEFPSILKIATTEDKELWQKV